MNLQHCFSLQPFTGTPKNYGVFCNMPATDNVTGVTAELYANQNCMPINTANVPCIAMGSPP